MKAGLIGGSYQQRSLPFDAQRTINLYPVMHEKQSGKEIAAMYSVPGKMEFTRVDGGSVRGQFVSANGRLFAASGTEVFEILSDGTKISRGSLITENSLCMFDESLLELAVCDGTYLYIMDYATSTFARVTDGDLPSSVGTVTYLDGYFIVTENSTDKFYVSDLLDGSAWQSLNFASAESSPDALVRAFAVYGQLFLMGETTSEVWFNSGSGAFPFARVEGAKIETGCAAAHSVQKLDNTVFWLGKDKDGRGIVYRAAGFSPQRISTRAVEIALYDSGDLSDVRSYTYQKDGHLFYALTGGNLTSTWVFDVSSGEWHERCHLEEDGTLSTDLAVTCSYAFGKHLVGDKQSGVIYELRDDVYTDAGNEIFRRRVFSHIFNESRRFRINYLQVDFENGVGEGKARLRISENGARTWSPEYEVEIGDLGQFTPRVIWRRLGSMSQATFEVTITDAIPVKICGAYFG